MGVDGKNAENYEDGMVEEGKRSGRVVKKRVFKAPQNEDKITEMSYKSFAYESKRKIRWAVTMYDQWRVGRMKELLVSLQIRRSDMSFVNDFSKQDLCYAMSRFIREVKKVDNSDFPPNSLREIVIVIQMHLHQKGVYWKLLDDSEFVGLRNILDNTMKERTAQGLGVRKSCDIISLEHEDKMFKCGALGEENPEQLLRTII